MDDLGVPLFLETPIYIYIYTHFCVPQTLTCWVCHPLKRPWGLALQQVICRGARRNRSACGNPNGGSWYTGHILLMEMVEVGTYTTYHLIFQGFSRLMKYHCWWFRNPARKPVEGKIVYTHYLQCFIRSRWVFGISSINRTPPKFNGWNLKITHYWKGNTSSKP